MSVNPTQNLNMNIGQESMPNIGSNPDSLKVDFEEIKKRFKAADVDEKIEIYTTTSGLTVEQFKELLRSFPLQHLEKLERAMEEGS